MVEVWFGLLAVTLTVFVVLDGWDIGAGMLHFVAAKTGAERREIVAAIGPLWSWHEVWLLAAGGTFLLAFSENHVRLVRRVLSGALVGALVVHPARRVHRGRRPHR
jgi:cytochrome bd-type quinol oxidase subunit 2